MKDIKFFNYFTQSNNKKEKFVFGFYIAFILIMIITSFLDYQIKNYNDMKIELSFGFVAIIGFAYLLIAKNSEININIMVLTATLMTYVLSSTNGFGISFFHVVVPLSYFLFYTLKKSLILFFIHVCIVFALYTYGVLYSPDALVYKSSLLISRTTFFLFILAFGIFYHLAIENTYKKLEYLNKELELANYHKEILLNETNHRVKNNLQMISNMLGLQKKGESDKKIIEILEKNRSRIHSISMVHEILYKYDSFEKILFYTYMTKLTFDIKQMYDSDVNITISNQHVYLYADDVLKLGIITNELLTNSLKHAFTAISGEVEIGLYQKEDHLLYTYRDNGQKEVNLQSKESLGFRIVNMMAEQMETDISILTKKGFGLEMKVQVKT